jgi:hypothetical protein
LTAIALADWGQPRLSLDRNLELPVYPRRFVKITSLHRPDSTIQRLPNFPRNLAPDFGQYTSERPEITSQNEDLKKAKQ